MKRVVRTAVVVAATLTSLVLLWEIRLPMLLLMLSFGLSASIDRIANGLSMRLGSRGRALLATYSLTILGGLIVSVLVGAALVDDLRQMTQDLADTYKRIATVWSAEGGLLSRFASTGLPSVETLYEALTSPPSISLAEALLGVTVGILDLAAQFGIVVVLSVYWSLERGRIQRSWLFWVSEKRQKRLRRIWSAVDAQVGAYIQSQVVQSLVAAFLLWAGYRLLGLRYPMILAIGGAVARLVPWVGTLVAAVLPMLAGLRQSTLLGIVAMLFSVGLLTVLDRLLATRFHHVQRHSSLLTLLLLVTSGGALGFTGAVLAPLLAVSLQTALAQLWQRPSALEERPTSQRLLHLEHQLDELTVEISRSGSSDQAVEAVRRFEALLKRTWRLYTGAPRSG
jgi:putative permease